MSHRLDRHGCPVNNQMLWMQPKDQFFTMTATTPTVSERALRMLELIAKADEPPTLNELMAQLDLAKAPTHRRRQALRDRRAACRARSARNAQRIAVRSPPGCAERAGQGNPRDLQH